MIGGRVLDVSALVGFAAQRSVYAAALVWTAVEESIVLVLPSTAVGAAWAELEDKHHPVLEVLLALPVTVVDAFDVERARSVGQLGGAQLDAHAGACARERGWPLVTADPARYAASTESIPNRCPKRTGLHRRRLGAGDHGQGVVQTVMPTTPRENERKDDAAEVVLTYLRTQAEALRHYDPLVRQDVPDALHQMRVATRRMRSALQVFGPVLDRQHTRWHTDELKWLAGVLGPARDLEVLRQRIQTAVAALPAELVVGPVGARLVRVFGRREAEARAEVLAALGGSRYLALLDALDDLLADPPLTARARRPARRELPRLIGRTSRRVARRMQRADQAPAGEQRDAALHEVRKAAKRLRYAAEAAVPALGRPARRLRKRVKAVQQLLGEHQDAIVARPMLRDLGMQAHLQAENGFTYGVLHRDETARAQQAEGQLAPVWRKLTRAARKLTRAR